MYKLIKGLTANNYQMSICRKLSSAHNLHVFLHISFVGKGYFKNDDIRKFLKLYGYNHKFK